MVRLRTIRHVNTDNTSVNTDNTDFTPRKYGTIRTIVLGQYPLSLGNLRFPGNNTEFAHAQYGRPNYPRGLKALTYILLVMCVVDSFPGSSLVIDVVMFVVFVYVACGILWRLRLEMFPFASWFVYRESS